MMTPLSARVKRAEQWGRLVSTYGHELEKTRPLVKLHQHLTKGIYDKKRKGIYDKKREGNL